MEINLKVHFRLIKRWVWFIAAFVFVCTSLTALYSTSKYVPVYQASTKLIFYKTVDQDLMGKAQIDNGGSGVTPAIMATFKEIIKTPAIMDKVVQRYPDLNLSADQLINIINVSNVNDSQVMTITAANISQEKAVKIVNAVLDVFQVEIPKIMKVDNVTILNRAKVQDHPIPVNKKSNSNIMLSFTASLIVAIGIIFLLDALDDTIKTDEDIHSAFEITTLAVIPLMKQKKLRADKRVKIRKKTEEVPYVKTIH
ncbi:Wzz/FepE/Etk N-terminal domain-containing protein [Paenibacillus sp. GP183]|uniref:YveK family protein n=1 Tax=Paenibacillus sp. GP183 TaxID=1882751 RepID=UPI000895193B|nr:Wzz/FepE/Etk N-terminal domain-containing protein [Paenibacillus sp. GP183]SEC08049.1 Capsular polysaccharide biosynthesis protein [Paenibacillus sp. GP183]